MIFFLFFVSFTEKKIVLFVNSLVNVGMVCVYRTGLLLCSACIPKLLVCISYSDSIETGSRHISTRKISRRHPHEPAESINVPCTFQSLQCRPSYLSRTNLIQSSPYRSVLTSHYENVLLRANIAENMSAVHQKISTLCFFFFTQYRLNVYVNTFTCKTWYNIKCTQKSYEKKK